MTAGPPRGIARRRTRSTSLKLALANAAVLATGFALLLVLVLWLADRFMVRHVAESVEAEIRILQSEFEVDGRSGARALIEQRVRMRSPSHDRRYRLEDAQGNLVAGNLDAWPADAPPEGVEFRMKGLRPGKDTDLVMRWVHLGDGSRLLVGYDEVEVQQVRNDLRRAALWSLGGMLLVSLAVGFVVTRTVLRPVDAIRRSALRIMDGDLSHRIALRGTDDDFDRLGGTLNAMLDRIEKLIASVRGATDNIAHDLRSPLTRHRARLEELLREPGLPAAVRESLEHSLVDLDQVLATFRSLLRIASVESGLLRADFAPCDMSALLRDAVEFVEPLAEERDQSIDLACPVGLSLTGHRDLLFQAFINLLDNAVKYSPPGSRIAVSAARRDGALVVEIADRGPGIPEPERERVFERLYRLDRARNTPGLGLGLPLVKAIVEVHGGTVSLHDHDPGTRVTVRLPG